MKQLITLLFLSVILFSCSYHEKIEVELSPVDSLESTEQSGYSLSYIMDMDICDNKLYVTDFELNICHEFNLDDLSYVSSIGSMGKGPGELLMPCDIAVNGEKVLVEEYGNSRIQEFDNYGNSISVFKDFSPTLVTNSMQTYEGNVYFLQKVFDKEDNWLYKYEEGASKPVSNLSSLSDEIIEKYKSKGNIQIDYTIISNTAYVSFTKYNDFYKVDLDSEDRKLIPLSGFEIPDNYDSVTMCKAENDLLIMLYDNSGGKIETASGQQYDDYSCDTVIRCTINGKILQLFRIPRKTYLAMNYNKGFLYISELEDAIVYKFRLDK